MAAWKNLERKTARGLNGQRVGATGKETVDVEHPLFNIECKYRAKLSFIPWYQQALKHSAKNGKIPLLVVKQKGTHGEYAILKMSDLERLINGNQEKETG